MVSRRLRPGRAEQFIVSELLCRAIDVYPDRATDGTVVAAAEYLQVVGARALSLLHSRAKGRRNHGCPVLGMYRVSF